MTKKFDDIRRRKPAGLALVALVTSIAVGSILPAAPAEGQAGTPDIRVLKTEQLSGAPRDAIGKWVFSLTGPDGTANGDFDPSDPGPTSTKRTNEKGRGNWIDWNRAPGDYRLCEKFFRGWKSNLGGSDADFRPNGDRCIEFTLTDEAVLFRVNNRCPAARNGSR